MDESKQTKDLTQPALKIVWLAVQPRHYQKAQSLKGQDKEAYENYVVSLIYTLDGQQVNDRLSKKQVDQITAVFEEKFGGKK